MASTGARFAKAIKNNIFSTNSNAFLQSVRICYPSIQKYRGFSSTNTEIENDRDPAPFFFNPEVQDLLKKLTRVDLKKVFRARKEGQAIEAPQYKFMTDEELKEAMENASRRAEQRLQMPPVVKQRMEVPSVIEVDPALKGYDASKHVFTDITYGIKDADRVIVVRETDGTLRNADAKERQRLNQIYFPLEGREIDTPKLFQEEYLSDLLKREEYEFVLDLACVQFEPTDPQYHEITETVYEHINSVKNFDHLRSTRHFGPFAFHLAWNKDIDKLLLENIQTGRLDDAVSLVKLYYKVNPSGAAAEVNFDGDELKFIKNYIENDSGIKCTLELAVQTLIDMENAKREVDEGVRKAHGFD